MHAIAYVRMKSCEDAFPDVSNLTKLESIRNKIYAKLVNLDQNKEYLLDKPYSPIADLAVIYYIEMCKSEDYGNASLNGRNNNKT